MPIMKFTDYGVPVPVSDPPRDRCSLRASSILQHSKDRRPVASCTTSGGRTLYLCKNCLDTVVAEKWAREHGIVEMGEGMLAALRQVVAAPAGYAPPKEPSYRNAGIWHALRELERRGLVRRREKGDGPDKVVTFSILKTRGRAASLRKSA